MNIRDHVSVKYQVNVSSHAKSLNLNVNVHSVSAIVKCQVNVSSYAKSMNINVNVSSISFDINVNVHEHVSVHVSCICGMNSVYTQILEGMDG